MLIDFRDTPPTTHPDDVVTAYVCDQAPGDPAGEAAALIPEGLAPVLVAGAHAARFRGKPGQIFEGFLPGEGIPGESVTDEGTGVTRIALVGAGKRHDPADPHARLHALEKAGVALTAQYLASGVRALNLDLTHNPLSVEEAIALLLALRLRGFRHDAYRTQLKDDEKPSLAAITVIGAPAGTEAAWAEASAVAEGVEFTRRLVTEPANIMYPESFVAACEARFAGTGVGIEVLDAAAMRALGMGALLGVAQGSAREARLLILRWQGGSQDAPPVAFVGKGVTFDTGGISLKAPAGMEDMKWDMAGAGAVAGALLALGLRKARANVIGICGLVENMPDANAQRPGDVVTSMAGQTIEVINTDAEGRLVLCDALTYAQRRFAPAAIVDLATLTGAIIATLAHEYAGLFANDDKLAAALTHAGAATDEKLWRLPMGEAYDKQLESPIADMRNIGVRHAGSITAAQFLKRFIENDTPWAHLDIAGMAWADKPANTWGKGATGFGVRLLDRYIRDVHESAS